MNDQTLQIKIKVDTSSANNAFKGLKNSLASTTSGAQATNVQMESIATSLRGIKNINVAQAFKGFFDVTKAEKFSNSIKAVRRHILTSKQAVEDFKNSLDKAYRTLQGRVGRKAIELSPFDNVKFENGLLRFQHHTVSLRGEVDSLKKTFEELGASIGEVMKSSLKLIGEVISAMVKATAITASVVAVVNSIKVASIGDDIKDQAQKLFMSATAYQEWGYVLKQNGIQITSLKTSMRTFAKVVSTGDEKLKKYGITTTDISTAFEQAVSNIQNMKTEAERVSAAIELFGNRATELMPILNLTNEETKGLMETYRTIGGTMSNELIAKSDYLTDSILEMKSAWQGLKNALATNVIPVISKVVNWLTVLIGKITILWKAVFNITETFGGSAQDSIGSGLADNLSSASESAKEIKRTLLGIDELNIMSSTSSNADSTSGYDFSTMEGATDTFSSETLQKLTEFKDKVSGIADKIQVVLPLATKLAGLLLIAFGHPVAGLLLYGGGIALGNAIGLDTITVPQALLSSAAMLAGRFLICHGYVTAGAILAGVTLGTATGLSDIKFNTKNIMATLSEAVGAVLILCGFLGPGLALLGYGGATQATSLFNMDWDAWGKDVKKNWEDLKTAWAQIDWGKPFRDFASDFSAKWQPIKDKWNTGWGNMRDYAISCVDKVKEDWNNMKTKFKEVKLKVSAYIGTKWTDLKEQWQNLMKNFKDKTVNIKLKLSATVQNIKDWINTSIIGKLNSAFAKVPLLKQIKIPTLAKGGVLTTPTIAMMGEYAGARNNPEIATPKSLLMETINQGNDSLINAFAQMTRQIIQTIEEQDMTVSIGDDVIAKSASRGNNKHIKQTGKSLFAY